MERDPRKCKCGVCEDCIRRQELAEAAGKGEAPVEQEAERAAPPIAAATARRLRFSESSWSTLSSGSPRTDTPSSSLPVSPPTEDASSSSSALTSSEERKQDASAATLSSGSMPEISPTDVADHAGTSAPQERADVSESTMSSRAEASGSGTVPAQADTQAELSQATSASSSLLGSSVAQVTASGAPTVAQADMDVEASEGTVASGTLEDTAPMDESSLSLDPSAVSTSTGSQAGYPLEGASGAESSIRDDTLADVSNVSLSSAGNEGPSSEEQADGSPTSSTQRKTRRTVSPRTATPRAPSPETAL